MMLKLKLQYFGHLMWRTDLLEKTLMPGKIEGGRKRGQQRMRKLDGITDSRDTSLISSVTWWWTRKPFVLQFTGSHRVVYDWVTELILTKTLVIFSLASWIMGSKKVKSAVLWPHHSVCKFLLNLENQGKTINF